MIDGSKHSFQDNIALTRQVVEYAHAHGVVVEGELGRLAGIEDDVNVSAADSSYTDPDQVQEFVQATGVDSLAIAIGTSTGPISSSPAPSPSCGLTSWRRSPAGCPGSPSSSTGPLPSSPSMWRSSTPTAAS